MVRIDKIIYMITCFKSISKDLEPFQYSKKPKNFKFENSSLLVMKRVGVMPKNLSSKEIYGATLLGEAARRQSYATVASQ